MVAALLLLGSYLAGSIPVGVLACRARGVDIFSVGSGSTGATNVNRALGSKWAAAVFVADVLKAAIPALLAEAFAPGDVLLLALVGLATIAGHCWSVFLGFRGGKGVSCILGWTLAAAPLVALPSLGVFVVVVAATRYVSLGSILAVASGVGWSLLFERRMAWLFVCLAALTVVLHLKNIKRLLDGTERKLKHETGISNFAGEPGGTIK